MTLELRHCFQFSFLTSVPSISRHFPLLVDSLPLCMSCRISEELFWQNYFTHVEHIKQKYAKQIEARERAIRERLSQLKDKIGSIGPLAAAAPSPSPPSSSSGPSNISQQSDVAVDAAEVDASIAEAAHTHNPIVTVQLLPDSPKTQGLSPSSDSAQENQGEAAALFDEDVLADQSAPIVYPTLASAEEGKEGKEGGIRVDQKEEEEDEEGKEVQICDSVTVGDAVDSGAIVSKPSHQQQQQQQMSSAVCVSERKVENSSSSSFQSVVLTSSSSSSLASIVSSSSTAAVSSSASSSSSSSSTVHAHVTPSFASVPFPSLLPASSSSSSSSFASSSSSSISSSHSSESKAPPSHPQQQQQQHAEEEDIIVDPQCVLLSFPSSLSCVSLFPFGFAMFLSTQGLPAHLQPKRTAKRTLKFLSLSLSFHFWIEIRFENDRRPSFLFLLACFNLI